MKLFQRVVVIAGENRNGVRIENCLADIAELRIDGMAESVNHWGLVIAGDDDAGAAVIRQVLSNSCDKLRLVV